MSGLFDQNPKPREKATYDLPAQGQSEEESLSQRYAALTRKAEQAAKLMSELFTRHMVRRTYFYQHTSKLADKRKAAVFTPMQIQAEGIGLVVIYDAQGSRREYPAFDFDFSIRADGLAVLCKSIRPEVKFDVLLERIN